MFKPQWNLSDPFKFTTSWGKVLTKLERTKERENSSLWEEGESHSLKKEWKGKLGRNKLDHSFSELQSLLKCNWVQAVFKYVCLSFMVFLSSSSSLSGSRLLILAATIMPVISSWPTLLKGDSEQQGNWR